MAYRHLALVHGALGAASKRNEYLEKAMSLKDRLSERERYVIEASYYYASEETLDKSLEACQKLLELYPDDTFVNGSVAVSYYNLGKQEEAIPYYEKATKGGSEYAPSYTQLASCYRSIGENDKAKDILENYLENIGENAHIHWGLAYHYRLIGEYELSLAEAEQALALDPSHFLSIRAQALVYQSQNDLKKAENTYWKLMEFTEPRARYEGRNGLCSLYLLWGKYEKAKSWLNSGIDAARENNFKWAESEWHSDLAFIHIQTDTPELALRECEEARESALQASAGSLRYQRTALWRKGLALLANRSLDEAQETADGLKEFIESGLLKKEIRLYYHLLGRIEEERDNYSSAIDLLHQALSLYPDLPEFIDSLALVYYKTGDLKKAREQYEKIISLTPGGVWYGDLYSKAFYWLGKIHEQQGDSAKAIENYEKFLELWKDSDPSLPEKDDALTRLSALKNQ
jgi:tetratricopeptide (TPR) repeat protein